MEDEECGSPSQARESCLLGKAASGWGLPSLRALAGSAPSSHPCESVPTLPRSRGASRESIAVLVWERTH